RIAVNYATSISGSTSPAYTSGTFTTNPTTITSVEEGNVTRNVNYYEDEDEPTATNITKLNLGWNTDLYAETRIAAKNLTNYDYLTAWVRSGSSGNTVTMGFGESSSTEKTKTFYIEAPNTWQKIYWDISKIPPHEKDEIRLIRASGSNMYIDNVTANRYLTSADGSTISSTPNEYFQYRVILTTSNPNFMPKLYNVQFDWNNGFKIQQQDANTVRLYNFTGETQQLRLDAVVFGADLAEWYTVEDESIEPGDLVSVTGKLDEFGVPILRKSKKANDHQLIGGISTKAGKTLGLEAPNRRLLALAGRIPVKIASDSAEIQAGDLLTSSNIPGVAKKANFGQKTIGQSTENWTPSSDKNQILIIVGNSYSFPILTDLKDFAITQITSLNNIRYEIVNGSGEILENASIYSKAIIAQLQTGLIETINLVTENITAQSAQITELSLERLTIGGQTLRQYITNIFDDLTAEKTEYDTLTITDASGSAVAKFNSQGDLTLLGELNAQTASISGKLSAQTASVSGQLTAGSATLLGQLTAQSASISGQVAAASVSAETIQAEQINTDLLTARSARLDQLESRMAELEHIKAQTAQLVDATISGTLYATRIEGLDDQLAETLNQASFLDKLLGKKQEATQSAQLRSLASVFSTVESAGYATNSADYANSTGLADASYTQSLFSGPASDVSLTASAVFINNYFSVNGSGYVAQQLGVGEQLLVGNTMAIGHNFIEYQPIDPQTPRILHIQPSGKGTLSLMAGLMTLHENGQVLIDGDLAVTGKLEVGDTLLTNLIAPTTFGDSLQIKLATASGTISGEVAGAATDSATTAAGQTNITNSANIIESRLEIFGITNTPTATISAQGRASFEGGLNIGTQDLTPISTMSATVASQQPSGKATIRQGTLGITIKSALITRDSLIYVSPIGSTGNQVLYVKSQTAEDPQTLEQEGGFSVGFDVPISRNATFNWWIVN
ncbi:hypothetical protein KJ707_03835, partial [Patescibacteria group bacterium]|nr:hypothetical protein [Patescibacteria group bacterium]